MCYGGDIYTFSLPVLRNGCFPPTSGEDWYLDIARGKNEPTNQPSDRPTNRPPSPLASASSVVFRIGVYGEKERERG